MNRSLALISTLLVLPIANPALALSNSKNSVELSSTQIVKPIENSRLLAQSDSGDARVRLERGIAYFKQGKKDLALAEFNQVIKLTPNNEVAYLLRGTIYADGQQWQLALADLNQAIELNPQLATAYYGRGVVHLQRKDRTSAIADLKTAAQLYRDQKDNEGYQNVTEILKELGEVATTQTPQPENAKPPENNRLPVQPTSNDARTHFDQGFNYFKQGKNDLALAELNQAIELAPNNELAYLLRGNIYVGGKQWKLALADLSRAIELNPQLSTAYLGRAVVHLELQDRASAIPDLKTAARLFRAEKDTSSYQKVTQILKELGE
jgi:tetratricopeptide (TPR) repeat protein